MSTASTLTKAEASGTGGGQTAPGSSCYEHRKELRRRQGSGRDFFHGHARRSARTCSAKTARANPPWSKSWRDFTLPTRAARLEFNGEHVHLPLKPGDFRRLGMSFVHQNLGLAPSLTVLENLALCPSDQQRKAPSSIGAPSAGQASEALGRFGLTLDPDERVDRLSPVERALLAIVRAFEEIRAECAATGQTGSRSPGRADAFSAARGRRKAIWPHALDRGDRFERHFHLARHRGGHDDHRSHHGSA